MTFHHVHRYAQGATCVAFFNVCQMHKSLVLCAAITAVHLLRYSDMRLERSTIASHPQSRKVLATSGHVYMCMKITQCIVLHNVLLHLIPFIVLCVFQLRQSLIKCHKYGLHHFFEKGNLNCLIDRFVVITILSSLPSILLEHCIKSPIKSVQTLYGKRSYFVN